jgi:hypothetical protein
MALYDVEGDVKFAQTQIDTARTYREKEAKKQESFSKKLQGVNLLAQGANYLINQRADALEQNQAFKKASYETMMKRAETVRAQDAERVKAGTSQLDYLTNNIYNQLITQIETDSPLADISLAKRAFRKEAQTLAQAKLADYKTMIDTANNFGSFEDFEADYGKASGIPRSIFGWMTSGVKNVVRGETPESIKYKAEKEKDALYGTGLFDKFKNLEKSFTAYDARTNSPLNVEEILKKAEIDSLIKGKIFPEGVKVITDTRSARGTTTSKDILIIPRFDKNTGEIVSNPATNITLNTTVTRDKDGYLNADDINKLLDRVKPEAREEINNLLYVGGVPKIENADAAIQFMNANPNTLAVDWTDEQNITKAFPGWYSTKIKHAGFVNEDGKWQSISKQNTVTKEWEIDPDYRVKAVELELDEKSAFENFRAMGTSVLQLGVSSYSSNSEEALTLGKLIDDGYKDITTGLTQQASTAWNNIQQNDWYDIFQKQIDEGKEAFEKDPQYRITKLAENIDFTTLFPELNLTGEYSIYRDNKTNQIYIKNN